MGEQTKDQELVLIELFINLVIPGPEYNVSIETIK